MGVGGIIDPRVTFILFVKPCISVTPHCNVDLGASRCEDVEGRGGGGMGATSASDWDMLWRVSWKSTFAEIKIIP